MAARPGGLFLSLPEGYWQEIDSTDGKLIVSGSADKKIKLWDTATGNQLRDLIGHADRVLSVAFSPDGTVIASGSLDHKVKLWESATGRELRTLAGHTDAVLSIAFSTDGKVLASGSLDRTTRLWDGPGSGDRRSSEAVVEGGKPELPPYKPDPRALFSHPYYWAPFILIGNWR